MDDQKAARWEKWHARGQGVFIAAHLGAAVVFFTFSGSMAYLQFSATAPEGVGIPIWPLIVAPCIILCVAVISGLVTWHRNEAAYRDYLGRRGTD